MVEIVVDISAASSAEDFYAVFFAASAGVVPDYGGRNLDALLDGLGDVEQPITLVMEGSDRAASALGEWWDSAVGTLAASIGRSNGLVTIVLRAAAADSN